MTAIAFAEHGKPLGWVSKKLACDQRGIKYIHAVEIYLTEQLEPRVRDNFHTVLIARDAQGVRELNRIVSMSSDERHSYYTNRISFEEFLSLSNHIITTSACLASPLHKLPRDHPMYESLIRRYDYLEIQPHLCEEQRLYNQQLYELSMEFGIPLIAGTDTHSSSPYRAECRNILMQYKDQSYGNEDDFDLTWHTREELENLFREQNAFGEQVWMEAIENTNRLVDSVESFELDQSIKYPILYGTREKDNEVFTETVERKFQEKLANGIIPPEQADAFREAIDEEMTVFRQLDMCAFMLSMSELLSWCKEQGMAIGTARGSVGGSRVAYVTDIIDMNPETWHTMFSRFANRDRREIGDIDVDVVESDRPAIFKHIISRFGEHFTARVGAYGTLAELAAIDAIGGALRKLWEKSRHPENFADKAKRVNWSAYKFEDDNPYLLKKIDRIKNEFGADANAAKVKYPELFYFYEGLFGTKVSQSVHPAGMVIAPIDLRDEYGCFQKGDDWCLVMDMDEAHDVGVVKYDFLVLKTVQVIRDTCRLLGQSYPRTHEINWNDEDVWRDMLRSPGGIFQMEGKFAFDSLKKFRPRNIFDMSLVTASIRPSGASYREELLAHIPHHNPSATIDELLENNLGYLIYQEDIIAFLQQVCGLSGSEADTVRRGIARKKPEVLETSMPKIIEGYCSNSDQPREKAMEELNEFLQIIEDASSYMFGYNHSIAYCLLGYLCARYRYYHPVEFITAFLNNAANDEDIYNGTMLAKLYGIQITSPKFGASKGDYSCDTERKRITKGLSSVKHLGKKMAESLYELYQSKEYTRFSDVLFAIKESACVDSRQLGILIHIDFFSDFGNQRELENIVFIFDLFKQGTARQIKKERIAGSYVESIVSKYASGTTKAGKEAASWSIHDVRAIIAECEDRIKTLNLPDLGVLTKVRNYAEAMGYSGYVSGNESDRPKLYVKDVFPVKRKRDGKQFGYNILTQSIGSGIESRFTVFNRLFNECPIQKGDVIYCKRYERDGQYFTMTEYRKIMTDDDPMEDL